MFEQFKNSLKYLNPDKVFKNNCKIVEINEGEENLIDGLGITKERYEVLVEAVKTAYKNKKNGSTIDVGVEVSEICLHPNELFVVAQMICEIHIKMAMKDEADKMLGFLRELGKRGKSSEDFED